MTTIAIDSNYIMASDSRTTRDDIITNESTQKIYVIDKFVLGFAGKQMCLNKLINYLTHLTKLNFQLDDTLSPSGSYECICYFKNKVYLLYPDSLPYETIVPRAIGSGWIPALAAMKVGLSSVKAVEIAKTMDVYSGGDIQMFNCASLNWDDEIPF